jgi:hypothetical protein
MSNFLGSLLSRHVETGEKVLPRLPGNFEPVHSFPDNGISEVTDFREGSATQFAREKEPSARSTPKPGFRDNPSRYEERPNDYLQHNNEQVSHPLPGVFPAPIQTNSESYQSHIPLGLEGRVPIPNNPLPEAIKPFVGAELNPEKEIFTSEKESGISTERKPITRVKELESIQEFSLGERGREEKGETVKDAPSPYLMPSGQPSGFFGEPPGMRVSGQLAKQVLPDFRPEARPAPVIKVSIGQINVRAVAPQATVNTPKPKEVHKPLLTLEDYLKGRG